MPVLHLWLDSVALLGRFPATSRDRSNKVKKGKANVISRTAIEHERRTEKKERNSHWCAAQGNLERKKKGGYVHGSHQIRPVAFTYMEEMDVRQHQVRCDPCKERKARFSSFPLLFLCGRVAEEMLAMQQLLAFVMYKPLKNIAISYCMYHCCLRDRWDPSMEQ
jgi:hypothetical protein